MPKRVGLFMDASNLYYCLNHKKHGAKLDYKKYYDYCKDFGEITVAKVYGSQLNNNAVAFIHALQKIGYDTIFKEPKEFSDKTRKADWDVGMAVDMIVASEHLDRIILGSADSDMTSVVQHLKEKGIEVIVLASGVSMELKKCAVCIEIADSLLEDK